MDCERGIGTRKAPRGEVNSRQLKVESRIFGEESQRHRAVMQEFFGSDGHLDVEPILHQAKARRAYFYDSVDTTRRPGESDEVWQVRVQERESFLSHVQSLSGFHVRRGTVSRGKKREQKEVDVQLTVDMLTHGFNGSMSKAVLLAGDRDFRPVVDALVRHGVFVDVWYHRDSFSQELPGAADFGHEVRFRQLYTWNTEAFQRAHRIPDEEQRGGSRWGQLVKAGSVAGCPVELYKTQIVDGKTRFHLWITTRQWELMVSDEDSDLIGRYAAIQYAPIAWEANTDDVRVTGAAR